MSETLVTTKVRESRSESGQIFRITALTPSRRIVGSVDVVVPVEPGDTLESHVGKDRQKQILELFENATKMLGDAVENRTAKGS